MQNPPERTTVEQLKEEYPNRKAPTLIGGYECADFTGRDVHGAIDRAVALERARCAAEKTTNSLPIWSGEFILLGVTLHCHVLSDGRRIIEAHDVANLFEAMGGDIDESDDPGVAEFARWMKGTRLWPII